MSCRLLGTNYVVAWFHSFRKLFHRFYCTLTWLYWGTESHQHEEPRAFLVDGASFPLCSGQLMQPDLVWSLSWLQHCRSAEAARSSAFPHAVLCWNYADGLKDSTLAGNSLSCHKPGLSAYVGVPVVPLSIPSDMGTSPMGSCGRSCSGAAGEAKMLRGNTSKYLTL